MPRPCMTLPWRAEHALGSSTGRRSSPGGRRSWDRGRGRPACRSSRACTWGTPSSCLQAYAIRRDLLHITYSGRTVPVAAAIRPTRAPVLRSPPACLGRRRTLSSQLRGAAELKFAPTKCRPQEFWNRCCSKQDLGVPKTCVSSRNAGHTCYKCAQQSRRLPRRKAVILVYFQSIFIPDTFSCN